jgi:hypothetical protein
MWGLVYSDLSDAGLWFVVFPLKGQPIAAGWDQMRMAFHAMIHGAWGLGMALLLRYRP